MTSDRPPATVEAAAHRIRLALRKQEAEMIDSFGTSLGPGQPRPDRGDLLTILDHLGCWDDPAPTDPAACGEAVELWDVTTYCVRGVGHPLSADERHRTAYGVEWGPVPSRHSSS
jgi:hypothetical protein